MADPYIGEIRIFAFTYPPRYWTFCAGQIMSASDNQALFALIGNIYGGDGRTTMGIPNLTSRMPMGFNMGQPYPPSFQSFQIGSMVGLQTHTLSLAEMSPHSHTATFTPAGGGGGGVSVSLQATTDQGDSATPSNDAYLAQTKPPSPGQDKPELIYKSNPTPGNLVSLGGVNVSGGGSSGGTVAVASNGGGQPFSLMNPTLALNFSIALQGEFPARN